MIATNGRIRRILLKNSDFAETRNFACPQSHIAHLRNEGIAVDEENLVLELRRALWPASSGLAPLQNKIDENRALIRKRLFQQYWRSQAE